MISACDRQKSPETASNFGGEWLVRSLAMDFRQRGAERSGTDSPPPRVSNPLYQPLECLSGVTLFLKHEIRIIEGLKSSSTEPDLWLRSPHNRKMQYRNSQPCSSVAVILVVLFLSVFAALPTSALPLREIGTAQIYSIDISAASAARTSQSTWVELILGDWVGGSSARLVAELAAKSHIKGWRGRKKYRGIHH